MFRVRVEEGSIIRNHESMAKELILQIKTAAKRSKDILVESIREDLAGKILRPRESDGGLSDAITGEVVRRAGGLLIGIGDISKMDKEAPHWYLQEHGGKIAVNAVPGFFVDAGGQEVPFATSAGRSGAKGSQLSNDLFIYKPNQTRSIMWIKNPVKPKHYFSVGELKARDKVLSQFETALRRAFR